MIAAEYAHALKEAARKEVPARALAANLRAALTRRRHLRLLPQIFAEYQKLELKERRQAMHRAVTPERERVRILVELYKKLIAS